MRFGEGGETAKGRRVGVSQRVGPGHQRDLGLRDLYTPGRGKRDGDECPFPPASLKSSRGLPLTAVGVFVIIFTPPFSWDVLTFVGFTQRRAAFLAENPFPFLITAVTQTVHLTGCENFLIGFI